MTLLANWARARAPDVGIANTVTADWGQSNTTRPYRPAARRGSKLVFRGARDGPRRSARQPLGAVVNVSAWIASVTPGREGARIAQ